MDAFSQICLIISAALLAIVFLLSAYERGFRAGQDEQRSPETLRDLIKKINRS